MSAEGVIACPHCEEPTLPNRLADGSLVCSCAAERSLPEPGALLRLVPAPKRPTSAPSKE
jgi:hypothetical protein